jgi:hypothetical protein
MNFTRIKRVYVSVQSHMLSGPIKHGVGKYYKFNAYA